MEIVISISILYSTFCVLYLSREVDKLKADLSWWRNEALKLNNKIKNKL